MSKNLPELQRSVQISANIGKQDYTGAYSQVAQTPSALGQLASDVAQRASNQFSMAMGYKAGENPRGSILPAFTESDKAFVDAYHASAKTTLSLQANKAMQDAQLMLAKEPQLNQGQIDSFASSMTSTFDNMLDMAPDAIKNSLRNSLQSSLDNSVASLQLKLIKQDRQNQISDANLYMQTELENILNTAQDGFDTAKKISDDYLKTIQSYADQHLISQKTLKSAQDSANITLQSGRVIGEAKRVMQGLPPAQGKESVKGGIDEYMANLMKDESIQKMPLAQQQAVLSNVIKQVKLQQGLQAQYQSDVYSEGLTRIKSDNMTSEFYSHAQEVLRPDQFSRLQASMIHTNLQTAKKISRMVDVLNTYQNSSGSLMASDKEYHEATQLLINQKMKNGKMDHTNAAIDVLSHAGRPDPIFNKSLNNELQQMQPDTFFEAVKIANGINQANPSNLNLDKKSTANLIKFNLMQAGAGGKSDIEILDQLKQAQQRPVTEQELIRQQNSAWMKENLSTTNQVNSFVKNILGLKPTETASMAIIGPQTKELMRANLEATGGDVVAAKAMTEQEMKNSWGYTYVNGKKEIIFLPIEKYLGLPEDKNALPFIYDSMATQLERQLESNNNNPNRLSSYKIVSKPDLEGVFKAKEEYEKFLNMKGGDKLTMTYSQIANKEADLNNKYLAKLKEAKNTRIEVIENTGGERRKLLIGYRSPAPLNVAASNTGQVIGDWQIVAWDEDGKMVPFQGFGLSNNQPVYRPNKTQILNGYASLYSINAGDNLTTEEKIAQIKEGPIREQKRKEEIQEAIKRVALFGDR